MTIHCTCPGWGRNVQCPFHGDAAQVLNRPDQEQLDRIEDKLDWLRWRMRWGEQRTAETLEEKAIAASLDCPVTFPVNTGPEPYWPGPRPKEAAEVV